MGGWFALGFSVTVVVDRVPTRALAGVWVCVCACGVLVCAFVVAAVGFGCRPDGFKLLSIFIVAGQTLLPGAMGVLPSDDMD